MKRKLTFVLMLVLALCFAACAASATGKTTTVLVYLCAGSDLQESACDDMIEMAEAETGDAVNTVVLAGQIRDGNLSEVRRARSRLYTFGSYDDGSWGQVDLGEALDAYARFDVETAAEVRQCLARAVTVNRQTDNLDTCCGISILIPQDTTKEFDTFRDEYRVAGVIPNWIGFLDQYVSGLQGGSWHFSVADAGQVAQDTVVTGNYTPDTLQPGGGDETQEMLFCFVFNDIFGDYTMSEMISFEV